MTDYTPEQLDDIADFTADIAKDTAKALASAPRLKEERDELLVMMKALLASLDSKWEVAEARKLAKALIERIDSEQTI